MITDQGFVCTVSQSHVTREGRRGGVQSCSSLLFLCFYILSLLNLKSCPLLSAWREEARQSYRVVICTHHHNQQQHRGADKESQHSVLWFAACGLWSSIHICSLWHETAEHSTLTKYFHSLLTKRLSTENASWTSQNFFMLLLLLIRTVLTLKSLIHDSLQKVSWLIFEGALHKSQ